MSIERDSIWLKAAVVGGLWASFEIILGSMLHNLHLPFSGTIMATFSVVLMIAFQQVWPLKGLIWRAGLIAGLMKSLSPSAVILGPMTGIMMEGLVMEAILLLTGRHLAGYMLAGVGALLSAIIHKVINLLILYGSDIVSIYLNLFNFLKKQAGNPDLSPESLVVIILGIYTLLGVVAALTGYLLGRMALKEERAPSLEQPDIDPFQAAWEDSNPQQSFRIGLLMLHILMVPVMLFLVNRFGLHMLSLIPATLYLAFLLLYYPRIKKRLAKPFFWSQLLIMILFATLFYHRTDQEAALRISGFLLGLEMSLRAVLIVSAFSAFSVEIRNPRITNVLLRKGFGQSYAALSLAFNSLPAMLDRSDRLRSYVQHPVRSFSRMISEARLWLRCYQTQLNS